MVNEPTTVPVFGYYRIEDRKTAIEIWLVNYDDKYYYVM